MAASAQKLARLQQDLGYEFQQDKLLLQALSHRSHGQPNNERLEFLGDAVLGFVVAGMLYEAYPRLDEGALSRLRASLVKESSLAALATQLNLSQYLRLGEGELKSGGFRRPSILADALEAIFAATYLDGGFNAVQGVIQSVYRQLIATIDVDTFGKDAKTLLQELLQGAGHDLPQYEVVATHGAAHSQTFDVSCSLAAYDIYVTASGHSRRSAEQKAAAAAMQQLQQQGLLSKGAKRTKLSKKK